MTKSNNSNPTVDSNIEVAAVDAQIKIIRELSGMKQSEIARDTRQKISNLKVKSLQDGLEIAGSVADLIVELQANDLRKRQKVALEAELRVQELRCEHANARRLPPPKRAGRPPAFPWKNIEAVVKEWYLSKDQPPNWKQIVGTIRVYAEENKLNIAEKTMQEKATNWQSEWRAIK